jgi:hypothetical protein
MTTPSAETKPTARPLYFCKDDGVISVSRICRHCQHEGRVMTRAEIDAYVDGGRLPTEAKA